MAERDFNLQMTGEQVKNALQQLEDRVAEGWAVGAKDGVPVTSGSPYYENNAKYYAEQAGISAQAAADSAATAEQEVEDGIREGIAGAYVQESATPGAVVTFDDGADNIPLKDLKVNLDINQPGTGDPSPSNVRPIYPVTEAEVSRTGKNIAKDGYPWSISATGIITHSTLYNSIVFRVVEGQRYTHSINGVAMNPAVLAFFTDYPQLSAVSYDGSRIVGGYYSFTAPITGYAVIRENADTKAQVELGYTVTAYEPFGATYPVNIGINQWDEVWENGIIDANGADQPNASRIRSKNYIPCIAGTQYYASRIPIYVRFYDASKTFVGRVDITSNTYNPFIAPSGAVYMRFCMDANYGATYLNDISLNFPARFTDYYAYTGNVVYGGELDVTTGVLTSRYASVDLGTLNYTYSSNGQYSYFYAPLPLAKPLSVCYADRFKYVTAISDSGDTSGDNCCRIDGSGNIRIRDLAYTNVAAFKAAMSGAQLVYELATPISIQLTPTEVDTLRGDNVIWADCGDITNCEYRADLKMYIDKVVGA